MPSLRRTATLQSTAAAAAVLCAATLAACRSVPAALGTANVPATAANDGLFGGIAARFTGPQRDSGVRAARRRITLGMLTPSRVFRDRSIWHTAPDSATRLTGWRGYTEAGAYRFSADTHHTFPERPGDARHALRLRRTGDDEFEWHTTTDFGIGRIAPGAIAAIPVAWISAGERATPAERLVDVRTSFPRSTHAWGPLFSIESLAATLLPDGSWHQRTVITLHPDRAAKSFPAFGAWLDKYVSPLRLRLRLRDSTHTWFDASFRADTLAVDLRSRDGRLLPLDGAQIAMPDTVILDVDASARLMFFRVAFKSLRGRFVTLRDSTTRGWSVHFATEPDWELPLLTEQMLRSPLKRPFQGTGIQFRIAAVARPDGPQNTLSRQLLAPVQESVILRFLSRLLNSGIGDYVDGADRETNEWLALAFGALHADTQHLLRSNQRSLSGQ